MVVRMSQQEFKEYVQSIVNTCDVEGLINIHNSLSSESTAYTGSDGELIKVAFADEAGELEEYKLFSKNYKGE